MDSPRECLLLPAVIESSASLGRSAPMGSGGFPSVQGAAGGGSSSAPACSRMLVLP